MNLHFLHCNISIKLHPAAYTHRHTYITTWETWEYHRVAHVFHSVLGTSVLYMLYSALFVWNLIYTNHQCSLNKPAGIYSLGWLWVFFSVCLLSMSAGQLCPWYHQSCVVRFDQEQKKRKEKASFWDGNVQTWHPLCPLWKGFLLKLWLDSLLPQTFCMLVGIFTKARYARKLSAPASPPFLLKPWQPRWNLSHCSLSFPLRERQISLACVAVSVPPLPTSDICWPNGATTPLHMH